MHGVNHFCLRYLLALYDIRLDKECIARILNIPESSIYVYMWRLKKKLMEVTHIRNLQVVAEAHGGFCVNYAKTSPANADSSYMVIHTTERRIIVSIDDALNKCETRLTPIPINPGLDPELVCSSGIRHALNMLSTSKTPTRLLKHGTREKMLVNPLRPEDLMLYYVLDLAPLLSLNELYSSIRKITAQYGIVRLRKDRVIERYKLLSRRGLIGRVFALLPHTELIPMYIRVRDSCAEDFYLVSSNMLLTPEIYITDDGSVFAVVYVNAESFRMLYSTVQECKPQVEVIIKYQRSVSNMYNTLIARFLKNSKRIV